MNLSNADRKELMAATTVDPRTKPCPHCGNDKLWVGNLMATVKGVQCLRCGAELAVSFPNRDYRYKTIKELEAALLARAIRMWNRRTKS